MSVGYLMLGQIAFLGPDRNAAIQFQPGINVICGASDTGKSFLAEAIDFMLGGSDLRQIPETIGYGAISIQISSTAGNDWTMERAITGGDFSLSNSETGPAGKLKQQHAHGRIDNISGFLLDKIGLVGKKILKSSSKGTTISLSFRNLARLVIVQEGEIQQRGSPFWGGQYTLKTAELSTVKLLLTGVDDSAVVSAADEEPDNSRAIALLDDLILDLSSDVADLGSDRSELLEQHGQLEGSIEARRESLASAQSGLRERIILRRQVYAEREEVGARLTEIGELLQRFELLRTHYSVDQARLASVRESGSLFIYLDRVSCPLCGASPDAQHAQVECDGNVSRIVEAASAEIDKIASLAGDLQLTVNGLVSEREALEYQHAVLSARHEEIEQSIRSTVAPEVESEQDLFSQLVEQRSVVVNALNMFERLSRLNQRRAELMVQEEAPERAKVSTGLPDAVANQFSKKLEHLLRSWNFPGECRVHFDKESSDFVIDGKPRGSRGKGLRAISHAAISIGLLEYCRERSLPHPGFVVLDSPLLAYYEPEGEDDVVLQGSDLKERFYDYLKRHHGQNSQIIIIENQHPPESVEAGISTTVFTRNPSDGRFGLLL